MTLHHLEQANYLSFTVTDIASGPRHAETWTSTIIGEAKSLEFGFSFGRHFLTRRPFYPVSKVAACYHLPSGWHMGTSRTKANAREIAAYSALRAIGHPV